MKSSHGLSECYHRLEIGLRAGHAVIFMRGPRHKSKRDCDSSRRRVIALTPELTSWFSGLSLAGFEVTLYGRFWVTTEGFHSSEAFRVAVRLRLHDIDGLVKHSEKLPQFFVFHKG